MRTLLATEKTMILVAARKVFLWLIDIPASRVFTVIGEFF
jgi:hypothetical protein